MGLIVPTNYSKIGFDFGATNFDYYEDEIWHGMLIPHFHHGIDYWGSIGTPVVAAANGYVWYAGFGVRYIGSIGGNGVVIKHSENMWTIYAHLNSVNVSAGQQVVAGQKIGTMGMSGQANGVVHLHFELWTNTTAWGATYDDPNDYFIGGANAGFAQYAGDDIPTINPVAGATVKSAQTTVTADGYYAPPTMAGKVVAVYYDGLLASLDQYTIKRDANGAEYISPVGTLAAGTVVTVDYVTL